MILARAKAAKNIKSAVAHSHGQFKSSELAQAGLNLQAVFDLEKLPKALMTQIKANSNDLINYRQLILLGHSGTRMWEMQEKEKLSTDNPIDDYSIKAVNKVFSSQFSEINTQRIYPLKDEQFLKGKFSQPIGLQQLGKLVGWHSDSPLKLGINQQWGSWYAYRVALLTDSHFIPTLSQQVTSPCSSCQTKVCINVCPAKALSEREFDLQACVSYRKQKDSSCRDRCVARMACPVGKEHQYSLEQIQYHYACSMKMLELI